MTFPRLAVLVCIVGSLLGCGGKAYPRNQPGAAPPTSPTPREQPGSITPVPLGNWGGSTAALILNDSGGAFRTTNHCMTGTLDRPLRSDADGNFEASGSVQEFGPGTHAPTYPATYHGQVRGDVMTLEVLYKNGAGEELRVSDELRHDSEGPLPGSCVSNN